MHSPANNQSITRSIEPTVERKVKLLSNQPTSALIDYTNHLEFTCYNKGTISKRALPRPHPIGTQYWVRHQTAPWLRWA